jgi:hypothetical protein
MGELEDGSGFLVAVLTLVRGCLVAMFSCFAVAESVRLDLFWFLESGRGLGRIW